MLGKLSRLKNGKHNKKRKKVYQRDREIKKSKEGC